MYVKILRMPLPEEVHFLHVRRGERAYLFVNDQVVVSDDYCRLLTQLCQLVGYAPRLRLLDTA